MAPPTTTSASSVCRPACRRRGLMRRSLAAVMKVGNGLWNGIIMLTNRPLKWCNYLYQLTCATKLSHLWTFRIVAYATSRTPTEECSKTGSQSHTTERNCHMNRNDFWVIEFRSAVAFRSKMFMLWLSCLFTCYTPFHHIFQVLYLPQLLMDSEPCPLILTYLH